MFTLLLEELLIVATCFLNKGSQYYYNFRVNIRGVSTYGTFKNCSKITFSLKPGLHIIAIFISIFVLL